MNIYSMWLASRLYTIGAGVGVEGSMSIIIIIIIIAKVNYFVIPVLLVIYTVLNQ